MKKLSALERMSPPSRRRFLKGLSLVLAAPAVPAGLRYTINAIAGGEAYAAELETNKPRYFLEVILRDQWDLGHVMVAPSLATNAALPKPSGNVAGRGQAALFFGAGELQKHTVNGTDVYLTNESKALAPHVDSIAMIDLCEVTSGQVHGHESANPARSPGRGGGGPGRYPIFGIEQNTGPGNEAYYTSTPTPATMFNHWQKSTGQVKNGVVFQGALRYKAHHCATSLGAAAELNRYSSRDDLFAAYPDTIEDFNSLDTPGEAEALAQILRRADADHMLRRRFSSAAIDAQQMQLEELPSGLYQAEPRLVSLPLTPEEAAFWGDTVPPQVVHDGVAPRAQIWEQFGWMYKLISEDLSRANVLEFSWFDFHETREEKVMRDQAAQVALPLARFIDKLKAAGLWEQTTIAVYTVDGSRSPDGGSAGGQGKNTVMLCGGCVKGGYYGDIQHAGGASYRYLAPREDNGQPRNPVTDNTGRVSSAALWRTVMAAAGVPDEMASQFPDVAGAKPMSWLLRS